MQWSTKRVFYATPQTFLIDMAKKRIDASDIVLVIVGQHRFWSGHLACSAHDLIHLVSLQMRHTKRPEITLTCSAYPTCRRFTLTSASSP